MKQRVLMNARIRAIIIAVVIILVSILGVSYAFFAIVITGNEEASSINLTIADLKLKFTDGAEINVSGVSPGWSTTKTFSVKNEGTSVVYYDIKMYNVYSTFIKDELVYTLTSTNSGGSKSETIMPNNDGLIKARIAINPNVTQTYTMTITFKELNSRQDYNQGATYRGKIQIISPYVSNNGTIDNIKLTKRIMLDNTTAYQIDAPSKYVTEELGINYSKPSDYGFNGYYTFEDVVEFNSNSNISLGTTFVYGDDSGGFTLSGTTAISQTYSSSDIGKYTCYTRNNIECNNSPQELYKILDVEGSTVTKVLRYMARPNRNYWNGLGLYQTSTNTTDAGTTYFFRGDVKNNYVSFAGEKWRIVRINEDGSIRLIRDATYGTAAFNTSRDNAMYVGYMYGTSSDPYANTNPSNLKTQLEAYYDSKLASVSSFLAPMEFCNDRSYTANGSNLTYGAYTRISTGQMPFFSCLNEGRDLFTMTTSSRGNKKLTKAVGLITVDEMVFAGVALNKVSRTYLSGATWWYTASPAMFNSNNARVWYMATGGSLANYYVTGSQGVRPVISLKADVMVSGGSGTTNDPYVIAQ